MRWGVDKIHYMSHRGVDTSLPRCNGLCCSHRKGGNYGICRKVNVSGDNRINSVKPASEREIYFVIHES